MFEYHLLTGPVEAFSARLGTAGWPLQVSVICPSYSGLTQRIPAEGISAAFVKIFVNLGDNFPSLILRITSKHVLDKECEGVQKTKTP